MNRDNLTTYLIAVAYVAVTAAGLWLLRGTLSLTNSALIFLMVVLIIAMRQGTRPSMLAALLSFLCFNFFLIDPLYTFLVADPKEVLDLVVFLVVAVLTGQLAARAREQAVRLGLQAREEEILYHLTSAFNQLTTRAGVNEALIHVLIDDLDIKRAYILPQADANPPDGDALYLLLRAGEGIYGTLVAEFHQQLTLAQTRLLKACANQAAIALQRIDLAERAARSQSFEEADKLKTALLHAVSHDLRTPITIIKTSTSNLRHLGDKLPDAERVDMLETIETEADELDKMVGNLLDLSRLNAGALRLNIALNNLEEIAGDVAARAYQRSKEERVKIIFPEDMPLVPFDYGLILQALGNLADNALRYEPAGSQIEIRGAVSGNMAQVAVINHGPNIPAAEREAIFDPFHHGKDGHVGLGLAITRGIVEAHQGIIRAEDTPGGGATFRFWLPLEDKHGQSAGG